jgi:riboflavin biosynthesis pyrimidine reductase
MMANSDSHVTIHMAATLDGFIARKDGRVDWLETSDEFVGGDIALHLAEVKAYKSGMVELRYEVRGLRGESRIAT